MGPREAHGSVTDIRGNQWNEAPGLYPPSSFPGNLRSTSTGGGTFQSAAVKTQVWRGASAFRGVPQSGTGSPRTSKCPPSSYTVLSLLTPPHCSQRCFWMFPGNSLRTFLSPFSQHVWPPPSPPPRSTTPTLPLTLAPSRHLSAAYFPHHPHCQPHPLELPAFSRDFTSKGNNSACRLICCWRKGEESSEEWFNSGREK